MRPAEALAELTAIDWRIGGGGRPRAIVIGRRADGAVGIGEAAPLPGRSRESLADVARALAAFAADRAAPTVASARFALECAALDAAARARGVEVAALLAAAPAATVPINAVVTSADEARRAADRGVRTVKVKVAAGARDVLAAIRAAVGPDLAVRADANRQWPTGAALAELGALAELDLEYVEEPCPGAAALAARSPVPIALDETVEEGAARGGPGLVAWVVKPMLAGGVAAALELAARARGAGVDVVVTHSGAGPIELAACAELARAIAGPRAVGLDAHAGLARWRRTRPPQLGGAAIVAGGAPGLGIDVPAALADLAEVAT